VAISRDELVAAVKEVPDEFEPGELAYLALTSKPELAIRDRLAWILAKQGHRVAREWRERCDLAVLDQDGEPFAVLESKASYGHDTAWGWNPKCREIRDRLGASAALDAALRSDAEKVLRLSGTGDGYLLLTVMHRQDRVPQELLEFIAEARRPVVEPAIAERNLVAYLASVGEVSPAVDLADGTVEGIRVSVRCWLCGPVSPVEEWRVASAAEEAVAGSQQAT